MRGGMMAENNGVADVKYVPPVRTPDYVQGTFATLAVVQLVSWAEAVNAEFTMPDEVAAIMDGFRTAIADRTDIPTVPVQPKDSAEGGALV
jgi:hypothetical protein